MAKRSNAATGAYYKGRAKKWLIAQGYQVASLEEIYWIYQPGRPPLPRKRDQFGSDLHAISATESIYVQVKGGRTAKSSVSAARREFRKFTFPPFTKQWIMVWLYRAREPEIIEC